MLWRHCHTEECEAHDNLPGALRIPAAGDVQHDHGRSGMMIMLGDTFHNFVDGILIAAAFMVDVQLGIVTSIAIIAHEIPQEAGDFLILLNSGYTRRQALLFNLISSVSDADQGDVGILHAAGHESPHPIAAGPRRSQHDLCRNVRFDSWAAQASGNRRYHSTGGANNAGHQLHLAGG